MQYLLPARLSGGILFYMQCKNETRWNIFLFFFYIVFVIGGMILVFRISGASPTTIPIFDFVLIALATFRLIRLFVYDRVTKFMRDLFEETGVGPNDCYKSGLNAAIFHLFSCAWCVGVWVAPLIIFFYFLTPVAWLPIAILAIAGIASVFQLLANLIGWGAENLKLFSAKLNDPQEK